ncbi:hypothetical protein [Halorussus halophilus]|uniref:hypothetical protein n=1 Tax=Halorussus halophilus TaxID=2650975 RepID=UPI0013015525|nr:hypothetical protein [Halorussus halophilus]
MTGDDDSRIGEESASGDPLEGDVLVLTAAKASVAGEQVPVLVSKAQQEVEERTEGIRRTNECVFEDDERAVYLVPEGFWREVGEAIELGPREYEAVERAHAEQLRRIGRRENRGEEFETALELREVVVLGQ